MKALAFLLSFGLTSALALAQRSTLTPVTSVQPSEEARTMLKEIDTAHLLLGPQPAGYFDGKSRSEIFLAREKAMQQMRDVAVKFYEAHPKDPMRWEGILHVIMAPPEFITGFKDGFEKAKGVGSEFWIVDEKAKSDWKARQEALERALATTSDVPWEIQEKYLSLTGSRKASAAGRDSAVREKAMRENADELARRFPEGKAALSAYVAFARSSGVQGTKSALAFWSGLTNSPNAAVRARAATETFAAEALTKPIDLRFTAVDGREVDLSKLRGKVVLIDFWATWCGPCIAELPNVKKAYATWHDKGFEIVGISLDQADDRQKLIDFTKKNEMPWPQHFDGKGWKNEISSRYAISAIPAMFLLNREGVVISTNARGPKLEEELRRLLGE